MNLSTTTTTTVEYIKRLHKALHIVFVAFVDISKWISCDMDGQHGLSHSFFFSFFSASRSSRAVRKLWTAFNNPHTVPFRLHLLFNIERPIFAAYHTSFSFPDEQCIALQWNYRILSVIKLWCITFDVCQLTSEKYRPNNRYNKNLWSK